MVWFKRKKQEDQPMVSEDEIQNEIRKRILKEAQKREGKMGAEEATQATLDAMEDFVSLSREEMELIAQQVRDEFRQENLQKKKQQTGSSLIMWTSLLLIIVAFFWARRGSSWLFFSGLILLFVLLNLVWRHIKKDDE
ncbi:hypothetical protein KJ966_25155 [bacterium]|nr:hypothetical protein [bacterium]